MAGCCSVLLLQIEWVRCGQVLLHRRTLCKKRYQFETRYRDARTVLVKDAHIYSLVGQGIDVPEVNQNSHLGNYARDSSFFVCAIDANAINFAPKMVLSVMQVFS